ncbi:MAG: hypothetical protein U9R23_03830 [Candidatus Cloacimonadota bacterium]|nr:hypothetical protein [Candidatus Cloacimonadota bacterium]
MNLHIQYLTDNKGTKTAVQIPFKEWTKFIEAYKYFRQYSKLKRGIRDAFQEIKQIENGNVEEISLNEFLNEC